MSQHWVTRGNIFQHIQWVVTVLNAGTLDLKTNDQSDHVGHDMALASFDPFARIISPNLQRLPTGGGR